MQPSEIAKLSLVIFLLGYLANKGEGIREFWEGLFPALILMGGTFILILKQPDLGTAAALTGTLALMLFSAGAKFSHLLGLGLVAAPGIYLAIVSKEYRASRFLSFLDPGADPLGSGYHLIQSLYALGSGGPVGLGLGRSRQKWYYLPERHTDFIFAIIGEELGFLGAVFVLLLFLLFAWRGFRIAITAPDNFGSPWRWDYHHDQLTGPCQHRGGNWFLSITGILLPHKLWRFFAFAFPGGIGILLNISRYSQIRGGILVRVLFTGGGTGDTYILPLLYGSSQKELFLLGHS